MRTMPLRLVLALVVSPHIDQSLDGLDVALLQKANCWLSRRLTGKYDELLVVGSGFADEAALLTSLSKYGLGGAELRVVDPDAEYDADEIGIIVKNWLRTKQKNAIPAFLPTGLVEGVSYPSDGWWWTGISPVDDEHGDLAEVLSTVGPDSFREQAATWAEVLMQVRGTEDDDEDVANYENGLMTLTLARWLAGFDAASENNFFNFDYEHAVRAAGIDDLRLGFEAGRDHGSDLDDSFAGHEVREEGLLGAAARVCIEARTPRLRELLSEAFSGDAQLFWVLHSSIWPRMHESSRDALESLLGLRQDDFSELEQPAICHGRLGRRGIARYRTRGT
jgi:hypothetical protein